MFLPSFKSICFSVQQKKRKIDFHDGPHGSHLWFPIRTILVIFDLQVTPMLPTKFPSNLAYLFQKKRKMDFEEGGQPSWISDQNDFGYFWSTVTLMLPTKFQVTWPFSSGEAKNRFSRWQPSWTSDQNNFNYFPSCFLLSFKSIGLLAQEKKQKNRFSRWWPLWPSWISDQNNFSYFWSTSHPGFKSIGLWVQEKWNIDFQDGGHGGHLRF